MCKSVYIELTRAHVVSGAMGMARQAMGGVPPTGQQMQMPQGMQQEGIQYVDIDPSQMQGMMGGQPGGGMQSFM